MDMLELPPDIVRKILELTVRLMTIDQRLAAGIRPCELRCSEKLIAALESRPQVVTTACWGMVTLRLSNVVIYSMLHLAGHDRLCTYSDGIRGRTFWY